MINLNQNIIFPFAYANRHTIITGATGSGKTISLKVLINQFHKNNIPFIATDIKGDLSNIINLDKDNIFYKDSFSLNNNYSLKFFISDLGLSIFKELLQIDSIAQESILSKIFFENDIITDCNNLLEILQRYKNKSNKISIDSIQSKIENLIYQKKDILFTDDDCVRFIFDKSFIYSCQGFFNHKNDLDRDLYKISLMTILKQINDNFGEVGDGSPKLCLFFDECHLIFKNKNLTKFFIEMIKLCRSKGICLFLASQNINDFPKEILQQVSNLFIHKLNVSSTEIEKEINSLAKMLNFEKQDIENLQAGEAILKIIDDNSGAFLPTVKAKINALEVLSLKEFVIEKNNPIIKKVNNKLKKENSKKETFVNVLENEQLKKNSLHKRIFAFMMLGCIFAMVYYFYENAYMPIRNENYQHRGLIDLFFIIVLIFLNFKFKIKLFEKIYYLFEMIINPNKELYEIHRKNNFFMNKQK